MRVKEKAITRSITGYTLAQVAVRIAIVVAVATVISYYHVSSGLQQQALKQLSEYVTQRAERESGIFVLARDNLRSFADAYVQRMQEQDAGATDSRFDALFQLRDDGTLRLDPLYYQRYGVTGVIARPSVVTPELQRQLLLALEMLLSFGPAWENRFVNLFVTSPEGAMLMYWPGTPWGLSASSWEVQDRVALAVPETESVMTITDLRAALGKALWSDLHFDYAARAWVLSATEPVGLDDVPMLSVGHDMLLSELMDRVIGNRIEGTYNLILRTDGRLLAHPRFMDAIRARNGGLPVAETGDPNLQRIYEAIGSSDGSTIIDNPADDEYLAVSPLLGPEWTLVTVFPKGIIADIAFDTARLILLLGAVALLAEIAITYLVLKQQVARPLGRLLEATNRVRAGDFDIRLDESGRDEIARLAGSFNAMSRELDRREVALAERSERLASVNQQLAQELAERKRAEAEILRQREALHHSEKMSALGSVLAGVAHELNNPLAVVVGRSQMLEEQKLPDPLHSKVAKIREAAERCSRIVRTFLAMARQQAPARAPVQVNDLIRSAVDLLDYSLRSSDVEVELDLADELPELAADADQLSQVFTNIIVNAHYALQEQDGPRRLHVSTRHDASHGRIQVAFADNGPGVPESIRHRIFDPFFTSKPVGMGTGIGLSFSYGVVETHGGTLRLVSPADGGARFEIELPCVLRAPEVGAAEAATCRTEAEASGRSILVVDDEPAIAELLGEILEAEGYRVELVESGNAALARIEARNFDLVLSDLNMPDLDGRGFHDQIRDRYPRLLDGLIFMTGDTLGQKSRSFLRRCGCPVIEKPFMPNEVVEVVRRVIEG